MKTKIPQQIISGTTRVRLRFAGNYFICLFSVVILLIFHTQSVESQYTTLYSFLTEGDNNIRNPFASEPLVNGTVLYGMSANGGNNNGGCIFKMNTDGTEYKKLYDFTKATGTSPYSSLTFVDDSLCGTTYYGGASDSGVIFKMNVNGSGYRCLYQFNRGNPRCKLILIGDSLYGMTSNGGTDSRGSIFRIHKYGKGFKTLFSFPGTTGSAPYSSLTLVGDSLYGTTMYGGLNNMGVIFKIHRSGNGYKKIFDFSSGNGSYPWSSLTLLGDSIYGMTSNGGTNNYGVVFRIHKNSSGYKKLIDFSSTTGFNPYGTLTISGDSLYGMTYYDNFYYSGVLFKMHKNGSGYQKLVTFDGREMGSSPRGSLALSGTTLYGMTQYGGSSNGGVIFKVEKNGSNFMKLKDCFDIPNGSSPNNVITDGSYIYGTTYEGGANGYGTIYKTKMDGSGFQRLYSFDKMGGSYPRSALILLGDSLYGTTFSGYYGTIFRLHTDGTGYKNIYSFYSEGMNPRSSLIQIGDTLYGTTENGGTSSNGVVYKIHKNGNGYKAIYKFDNTNGRFPYGDLTQVGDSLYGMTRNGGSLDRGVIFKIHKSGNGFQKLFDFTNVATGLIPEGSLTLVGDSLYGMTVASNKSGIIFKIHRNGTGYKVMHDLEMSDGVSPRGSLTQLGNDLYGLTSKGAANNNGSLFKINIKTGVFTKLKDLEVATGAYPEGSLFAYNNVLYGSCPKGGKNGLGVVFKYKPVTIQATNIQFSYVLATQMNISFIQGDGAYRAVFICQGITGNPLVVNNTNYTATSVFGSGSQAGAGWYCIANGTASALTVTGLSPNTVYRIAVLEYTGESGEEYYLTTTDTGNPANTTTIAKQAQTISFGVLPVKVYGDADFNPGATINSGLTITYTSSNPAVATIVNEKIHIAGIGTSVITASQAGNNNYYAATSVPQTLLVNKSNQTITFPDLPSKAPGDIDFNPGATASSGLTVTYTSSNTAVATIAGSLIHIVGLGTTEITASQIGNTNYNAATSVVKVLSVKSSQTITFPAISTQKVGNADFNPGATASSGLPITYTSSNTNVATIAGGMVHIIGAGTTSITASQPGNSSYNAAPAVVQIMDVNPATAVKDLNTDETKIYPVPASDKLYVKIPDYKSATLQIMNINGQMMMSKTLSAKTEIIDVSGFAKGIYTIKLTIDDQLIVKKIGIQ